LGVRHLHYSLTSQHLWVFTCELLLHPILSGLEISWGFICVAMGNWEVAPYIRNL